MSLFQEHPCGDCDQYGKCEQCKCSKFQLWFNNAYMQMMQLNYLYDENRISIDGITKKELEKENKKQEKEKTR